MKKLFGFLMIAGMMSFVACEPSAEEKAAEQARLDSIKDDSIAKVEQARNDSIAADEQAKADEIARAEQAKADSIAAAEANKGKKKVK